MTEELRLLAAQALANAGVRRLPVRMCHLARSCNVRLFTYTDYARAAETTVEEIIRRFGPDGFTQRLGGSTAVFYRECANLRRVRWTVAHELAHVLLGHLDGQGDPRTADRQADRLARELLCPAAVVAACGCDDLVELCDISPSAARVSGEPAASEAASDEERRLMESFADFIAERKRRGQTREGAAVTLPRLRSRRL